MRKFKGRFIIWLIGVITLSFSLACNAKRQNDKSDHTNDFMEIDTEKLKPVSFYSFKNVKITKENNDYKYYFSLTNNSKEDFEGLIKVAFERKEVGLGFYNTLEIFSYSPSKPGIPLYTIFRIPKPPKCVDSEDGLENFVWTIYNSQVYQTGKGKVVQQLEQ